jgi:hypothetical protein
VTNLMVIPMSSGEYVLQIQEEKFASDHRVDLPRRLLDELGVSHERAKDVITCSVGWFREQDEDVPLLVNLGATWDEHPDFRRFLTDQLGSPR